MEAVQTSARVGSLWKTAANRMLGGSARPFRVAALVLLLSAAATGAAHAQAKPGASRTAEISAFGGYTYSMPDFGPDSVKNTGGTLGLVYTRFLHLPIPITPSLEARANYTTGDTITEKSVLGGLRGTYDFRDRFHPYFDIDFGGGNVKYNHLLLLNGDRGSILAFGGGLNVDVRYHFQVMVDAQSQHWNLGHNDVLAPNKSNYTLSPLLFTVGLSYRVPSRSSSKISDTK